MGIATFPNTVSPIKSIQRGSAVSAGNITITAVDVSKTLVNSFSTGSAGYVAATGSINAANGSTSGSSTSGPSGIARDAWTYIPAASDQPIPATWYTTYNLALGRGGRYGQTYFYFYQYFEVQNAQSVINLNAMNINGLNVGLNATSLTGGSTDITVAQYGAYLSNSTTLVVTGPCRYEVVEHY